jgi:uncharacterized protein YodC (DUF2158 family)
MKFKLGDLVQLKSGGPTMTMTMSPKAAIDIHFDGEGFDTIDGGG